MYLKNKLTGSCLGDEAILDSKNFEGIIILIMFLQRCKQTSVNQETGVEDKTGPIDILRKYRAPRGPTHANFGQHLIPLQKSGKVHVGDTIQIIEKKRELLQS